jgi:hypothetical protein
MSVDLCVFLRNESLPTHSQWQAAINEKRLNLVLDDFSSREHTGFLPCRLNGVQCGFEYYFAGLEGAYEDIKTKIGDRDRVVTLVLHGSMDDLKAAMLTAAVLTELCDGVFYDPQGPEFLIGDGVFKLIQRDEDAERERIRRLAEKDAAITDRRCPKCGAPCPKYRKTCQVCRFEIGRAL